MLLTAGATVTAAVIINENSLGARLFHTLTLVMTIITARWNWNCHYSQFMDRRVEIAKSRPEPGSLLQIVFLNQYLRHVTSTSGQT